jgi:hypothetical protein
MVRAAPFNPPSPNLDGKPPVPAWVPPPATQETHNFAKLKSIDLSKMDSDDPAIVEELVQEMKVAIRDDGFIFLENYGISYEQVRSLCRPRVSIIGTENVLSSTDNSRSPSTCTTISQRPTSLDSFSTQRPAGGLGTSTRSGSSATRALRTVSSNSTGTPANGTISTGSPRASTHSWMRSSRSAPYVLPLLSAHDI